MHQQDHFCYTCEIELIEDEEERDFTCPKCNAWYRLNDKEELEMLGYAGEM